MLLEPGVFGVPPGADFPRALVETLNRWAQDNSPEALARVTVYVNTARMQRRVRSLFDDGPATLLPRLRLVTDIGRDIVAADIPPAVPPLRRRLELASLVEALIEASPDLAPRAAALDLAENLAKLMDEMQGEGVGIDAIRNLDVSDASGHWARSQAFLSLVDGFLSADSTDMPDPQARLRLATERLIAAWTQSPPQDPVIVAGSTGSRGTTALLMESVARLPRGILLLPGFDFDMPGHVWTTLREEETAEDHPQFRFVRLLSRLGVDPTEIRPWADLAGPDPARNRLVSLSLRPAPVTDQWLRDGPGLGDLRRASRRLTLIEADAPHEEAAAIAFALREAVENGRRAALITPDRMLTRRVSAFLDRWLIEADDSAGRPLALSAPGRLLRLVSALFRPDFDTIRLLALLKHPLVHAGQGRGRHLLNAREMELYLRRKGGPHLTPDLFRGWAEERDDAAKAWLSWLLSLLPAEPVGEQPLEDHAARLIRTAEVFSCGAEADTCPLWDKPTGRAAAQAMAELKREAHHGRAMSAIEFDSLLNSILADLEVRDPDAPHPDIMIWGTMEARVQGADLVVLGSLNEGTWPESPAPDPWLNRRMRKEAGLLLPDRRIGLSAHDYQQAIAAPDVILTRCRRDADTEPVPSRWVNRLTNLLGGLRGNSGPEALAEMRARGEGWLGLARAMDRPDPVTPAEPRPAPCPPVAARPRKLSVTAVERLIRDPYAIYARYVLGLPKLDPLKPEPSALLRGQVLHKVFEKISISGLPGTRDDAVAALLDTARRELENRTPWPMARILWMAKLARVADWYVGESLRRADREFVTAEVRGTLEIPEAAFSLTATADRIDRLPDSRLILIDYKTGTPPTPAMMERFDKQLLLEALIARAGGFEGVPAAEVDHVAHIGLGSTPVWREHRLVDEPDSKDRMLRFSPESVRSEFLRLLAFYDDPKNGYVSRLAMHKVRFEGDYDHLARFGEWDDTQSAERIDVG